MIRQFAGCAGSAYGVSGPAAFFQASRPLGYGKPTKARHSARPAPTPAEPSPKAQWNTSRLPVDFASSCSMPPAPMFSCTFGYGDNYIDGNADGNPAPIALVKK